MNRGKDICKELKAVRKRIAEENDIPLEIKECTYEGPCRGTCPRCEAEVRYLENSLANRLRMGKVATVAGLALGLASCGGQVAETDTTPPPTTGDTSHSICEDSCPPMPEGPKMEIEEVNLGFVEVCGDVEELPPSPPPESCQDSAITEDLLVGEEEEEEGMIFGYAESDPEFPGGMEAMYKFLAENIKYPQRARENNIEGRVFVSFTVEKDGSITEPRVLRDIGGGCGQEAIRVVKMMPKWTPGKQRGKPVRVQFNLPVKFDLSTPSAIPSAPVQQANTDSVKVKVK